jgi:hypothetical protein
MTTRFPFGGEFVPLRPLGGLGIIEVCRALFRSRIAIIALWVL